MVRSPPQENPQSDHPVAQWTDTTGTKTWHHYTTDHLGTPIVATDAGGNEVWRSSLDPWGNDPAQGTVAGALDNEVFLRLPGQWESDLGADAVLGTGTMYYNVHRWYQSATGRYTRPDPLGLSSDLNSYLYAAANPLAWIDALGLTRWSCTVASLSGGYFIAAGIYYITCTSPCQRGQRTVAELRAGAVGIGVGAKGSISGAITHLDLDDNSPGAPRPRQLQGDFCMTELSVSIGVGPSFGRTRLGAARSSGGSGTATFGAVAFTGCGSAKLTNQRQETCCAPPPPGPPGLRIGPPGRPIPTIGPARQ